MSTKSLLDQYSREELQSIANISESWSDYSRKLGYVSNSGPQLAKVKEKAQQENIDTSHFLAATKGIERTRENVFIQNSTADQKTLRKFYQREDISYQCVICGQEPFWNGKDLTLILDHINGENHDDRLENLRWVCPNCNMQLPTTNRRKGASEKKYYCIDCGKEISCNGTRCTACAGKQRSISTEDMMVSREQLKELIRTLPFTKIGTKYGVSDNAIRKWCVKFNLPSKKSDIQKYSDEDWAQL